MDRPLLPQRAVDGLAERDPDAVAACYEALSAPLYRYLLSRCGDPTLAEDLVEATFLELVEAAPRISGGASGVRAWLFRAGRNNLLDAARKARRRGDQPLDERRAVSRPSLDAGPETLALDAEARALLRSALAELSDDQREVLVLRFGSGLSSAEVAAVTGRTVGAVKALQHRGLRALQRVLQRRATTEDLVP